MLSTKAQIEVTSQNKNAYFSFDADIPLTIVNALVLKLVSTINGYNEKAQADYDAAMSQQKAAAEANPPTTDEVKENQNV
jgi:hypothetical protein